MKRTSHLRATWIASGLLALLALPGSAQVPHDMSFTGRLVDEVGIPLAGPLDLELRVFDAETAGTMLYSEHHLGVNLDESGGFTVQLGLGTDTVGSLDAGLFSEVNRWLEVVVGSEVLTPRQIIGAVPWALVAERANELVRDPSAPRFRDCGDGTVADRRAGLVWEKKTGSWSGPPAIQCTQGVCTDVHDVDNGYRHGGSVELFTDFLARLNGGFDPAAATGCFAGRCDWRIPEISELQTILIGPDADPAQLPSCSGSNCIDPDFEAVAGAVARAKVWAVNRDAADSGRAWAADFATGTVFTVGATNFVYARAVRSGSCAQ